MTGTRRVPAPAVQGSLAALPPRVALKSTLPQGAVSDFNAALVLEPRSVPAFEGRAAAKHKLGDYRVSRVHLVDALYAVRPAFCIREPMFMLAGSEWPNMATERR